LTLAWAADRLALMDNIDFDAVYDDYKQATDRWVDAIRAEESLANSDHSMIAMELWDDACLKVLDAESAAKKARELYKNALRKKNYGF